ncbi:MAG TPA: glycosyltransferase family 9 protein [Gallionellaceae bacterium]
MSQISTGLNIAVVRFSALGDVAMMVPAVRHLQRSLPGATITWITSPLCYALLHGLEGVQFVVCDKPHSLADYRAFYRLFRQRRFDVVLAMQANLRVNLLYPALRATRKIGFDRTRAREGQWLFCNQHIPFEDNHLVDSFMSFATALGAPRGEPDCSLPISSAERTRARQQLTALPRPLIAMHPFASKAERNWPLARLAEVMRQAGERWNAGFMLTGGNSAAEREGCAELADIMPQRTLNLCGQTEPKQLAALLGEADVLIAPDTGPVHLARAMNTPVIGLYAVASPRLCGPYGEQQHVIDRYPQAVRQFLHKDPARLPWNTRVHHPDAMSLIQVDDVMAQLSRVLEPHA